LTISNGVAKAHQQREDLQQYTFPVRDNSDTVDVVDAEDTA